MRSRYRIFWWILAGVLLLSLTLVPALQTTHAQGNPRFFPETGYTVENDEIWEYFQARGGISTFGYPVSNTFLFRGFPVQIFQRHMLQVTGEQARPVNLLDPGLLPITNFGGLTFPDYNPDVAEEAPTPETPNYAQAVRNYLQETVPNEWEGLPVDFYDYYLSSAPGIAGVPDILGALEVWGFPTSRPMRDPNNNNFVYQRFQRGILHYDATQNVTRGILLGDAFKQVLRGRDLSPDLRQEVADSPLLNLYAPDQPNALARTAPGLTPPITFENTDLSGAFAVEDELPTFTSAQVYLVEEDTQGAGCNVNLVAWDVQFDPTAAPLTSALEELVLLGETPGRADLYNAAYITHDVRLDSVAIVDSTATIRFTGNYQSTRPCDLQWFRQQVRQTALQYDTVDNVEIFIGGTPIEQLIGMPVPQPTATPQAPVFSQVDVYFVALETGGPVGCGDTLVPVTRDIEDTRAPLTAAIQELISTEARTVEQGLYNALFRSDLHIESIDINNGNAVLRLVGEYQIGGVCDEPRVVEQIAQTAMQFATVDSVDIYINGQQVR